jgi:alpha-D-ribose 1-methylphosphonate 5-triphosphate synthase subunit PhnG
MNRKKRTEILIRGRHHLAKSFCEQINHTYSVDLLEKPNHSLVMVKMRETAKNTRFYIGEVFVTECKVKIQEKIGIGIVKGNEPELSYYLAVIDAAYCANLPITQLWGPQLEEELQCIRQNQQIKFDQLLKTKVNFETMDEELS